MYLPVPLFGFLIDRYNPRPLSFVAGVFFGAGYLLAALTYHQGPPHEGGWPHGVMVLAFVGVGAGTSCMYLSAITACAKNFGRGKHSGIALAMPIAAFGLSGLWQSQIGSRVLFETSYDGSQSQVDVYRYFLFLAGLLFAVGILGAVGLRIVDEEAILEDAVDEMERSGLLEHSRYHERSVLHDSESPQRSYGTSTPSHRSSNASSDASLSPAVPASPKSRKRLLLNSSTRLFLSDPTAYLLALGFFLITGPGEAYINNLGTLLGTAYPPSSSRSTPDFNTPSTHVSIIAITSTIARLLTGALSDLFAPSSSPSHPLDPPRKLPTFSRVAIILFTTVLLSISQILLATPAADQTPTLFPLATAIIGFSYGSIFALSPMIVSCVWGLQNFATNWGLIAVVPAAGAALWGAIYSADYQAGTRRGEGGGAGDGIHCYGPRCYQATFAGMAVASWIALGCWLFAWRGWRRKGVLV